MRFGLRLLARSPVFALTVSLLLGIGIGANTLTFSFFDALLLRSLPVPHPEQLVRLIEVRSNGFTTWDFPFAVYEQFASHAASLSEALCQGDLDIAFKYGESTERIRVNAVSKNFFKSLGIQAQLGRVLGPDDDKAGASNAVLSHDFWQRRFGGSPAVIGRGISLNGRAFTIAGVLPGGINGLTVDTSPDIRISVNAGRTLLEQTSTGPPDPLLPGVEIFGRLRPGVTPASAEAEIASLVRRAYEGALIAGRPKFANDFHQELLDSRFRLESAGKGVSALRVQFSHGLVLLMASVGLLLLLGCANVACLLLARSAARSQEIGMRLILGATRWQVARQLLTESLVLATSGGVLSVLLTVMCRPLLLAAVPPIRDRAAVLHPLALHAEIDMRVLGFAVLASLLTALVFGFAPALQGAGQDLTTAVRGIRTATARLPGRKLLVGLQVALCVLLFLGASLLMKTFERMRAMDPGFDRDHVVTFTVDPRLKAYKPERAKLLSQQLLEKTRELPAVAAAAIAGRGLMRGTGLKTTIGVAGKPLRKDDRLASSANSVTPGYFDTMGMHILAGRDFTWSDENHMFSEERKRKLTNVIVNEAFVRHFFPGQDALNKLIGYTGQDGLATPEDQIIGIVSNAKYRSLREQIPPTVYGPVVKGFDSDFILHLRTHGDPISLIAPVRQVLRSLDPELPFIEVRTLRQEVDTSLWQERLLAWLSTLFGCFAALLAGIGLFGALDFSVKAKTREIGIRAALGATPRRVVQLLLGETLPPLAGGTVLGIALYLVSARWIRQLLYNVAPSDPMAFGSALAFLAGVALVATVPLLWRAVRIDPASALRQE